MRHYAAASEVHVTDRETPGIDSDAGLRRPLPTTAPGPNALTSDLCNDLKEAGCPLAQPVQERLRFETLLAELSATFVNLPAAEVDTQIESALRRIVAFLDIDRSGFGEMSAGRNQLVITHSYEVPGVPPSPRIYLDEQMPWYARTIRQGEVIRLSRLPDDLPPEAVRERAYCAQVGLKSNLTIPMRVMGSVVGGIGFGSFRAYHNWPDELVQRLRLVGEILTNALARKRADEALQALAARLLSAQEEERRRIAREMHDDWTPRLALLGIDVARLEKQLGTPENALPLLRAMQDRLVRLSEDVHALSRQPRRLCEETLGNAQRKSRSFANGVRPFPFSSYPYLSAFAFAPGLGRQSLAAGAVPGAQHTFRWE